MGTGKKDISQVDPYNWKEYDEYAPHSFVKFSNKKKKGKHKNAKTNIYNK